MIPAAKKADLRAEVSQLEVNPTLQIDKLRLSSSLNSFSLATTPYQNRVRKAKKKTAEENITKAAKTATEVAKAAASRGKTFCIIRVDVGLDTSAVREAVLKVLELQVT